MQRGAECRAERMTFKVLGELASERIRSGNSGALLLPSPYSRRVARE